jgi:ABC-type multidrug transport system permease subunit
VETSAPESRGGAFLGLFAFVLVALAQGVIPYTHTVQFGPAFQLTPRPSTMPFWRDALNAAGIGLLVCSAAYLAFSVCFVSLCRAYGEDPIEAGAMARRTAIRRAWLYPMLGYLGLPAMLLGFGLPESAHGALPYLMLGAMVVPLFLLLSSAKKTAERAGVSPGWAWLVVLVPLLLAFAAEAILLGWPPGGGLLDPWLPPMVEGG